MSRPKPRTDFDLLIVGGGMVGACLAAAAASDRELGALRIALLDSGPPVQAPADDTVDLRVSAISRASQRILASVGAWMRIPDAHRSAYSEMIVWDAASRPFGDGALHFSASETSEPNLGHIIENRRLQWAIYSADAFANRVTLLRATLA